MFLRAYLSSIILSVNLAIDIDDLSSKLKALVDLMVFYTQGGILIFTTASFLFFTLHVITISGFPLSYRFCALKTEEDSYKEKYNLDGYKKNGLGHLTKYDYMLAVLRTC